MSMNRKRILSLFTVALFVASLMSVGRLATAQNHAGGTTASPEASPMSGHDATDTGTGAAYLTITNNGDEADRLIGASSDAAVVVEIHDMVVEDEVMSMIHLEDGLEIPAGESVVLEPMGLHVMLVGLNYSLMPGESFDITLTFERAGEVTVTAQIATELPEGGESWAAGDLVIEGVWSRPAPKLTSATAEGTPDATPEM
jgi:copper(I)-binding protein